MLNPSVVVLGGGLSGAAAAYALARAGWRDVVVVERGAALGGLAGSFERHGRFYPLGYHHILHRDQTLLYFLDRLGVLSEVRWRQIRMLFETATGLCDLGSFGGFWAFPMALADKLRFARLMLRAFVKADWSDWQGRSAAELVDTWGGPGVRRTIFEPLTRLKFDSSCRDISGAWLGARLHFREGSAPLGYIPNANWTTVLCNGVTQLLAEAGVKVRLRATIAELRTRKDRITEAVLTDGEHIGGDLFVNTVPPPVYLTLVPRDETPNLASIRYTALISTVCATRQTLAPDFYWLNLTSLRHRACGVFVLSSLNPTIGAPGDACVNFVTHLQNRTNAVFLEPDDELIAAYLEDFRGLFGVELRAVLDQHRPDSHVLAGVCSRLPEPSRPEYHVAQSVFCGNLPHVSLRSLPPGPLSRPAWRQDRRFCRTTRSTANFRRPVKTFRLRSMPASGL